jgi:hypothetical protein
MNGAFFYHVFSSFLAAHHDQMGMYMVVPGRAVNGRGVWQKPQCLLQKIGCD